MEQGLVELRLTVVDIVGQVGHYLAQILGHLAQMVAVTNDFAQFTFTFDLDKIKVSFNESKGRSFFTILWIFSKILDSNSLIMPPMYATPIKVPCNFSFVLTILVKTHSPIS